MTTDTSQPAVLNDLDLLAGESFDWSDELEEPSGSEPNESDVIDAFDALVNELADLAGEPEAGHAPTAEAKSEATAEAALPFVERNDSAAAGQPLTSTQGEGESTASETNGSSHESTNGTANGSSPKWKNGKYKKCHPDAPLLSHQICTKCHLCLPIEKFCHDWRHGPNCRVSQCRTRQQRIWAARRDGKIIQDAMTEIRRSKTGRMVAIVDQLVANFGGPNQFAKRWHELYEGEHATLSFRRRTFETIMAMDSAAQHDDATKRELVIQKLKRGEFTTDEYTEAVAQLNNLTVDELLDAATEPIRILHQNGLLPTVLKQLRERGELKGQKLKLAREALDAEPVKAKKPRKKTKASKASESKAKTNEPAAPEKQEEQPVEVTADQPD